MIYEMLTSYPDLVVQYLRNFPPPEVRFTVVELGGSICSSGVHATEVSHQLLDYLHHLQLIIANPDRQDGFQIPSAVARTAIRSLEAFVADGAWTPDILGRIARYRPQSGWDIPDLIQLERLRVEAAVKVGVEARPLRQQQSALVIVKGHQSDGDVYLLVRREEWPGYSLIGGKFEAEIDRDLEDTARREVEEELGLRQADFSIEALPLAPVHLRAISQRKGVLTDYTFEFFQLLPTNLQPESPAFKWFHRDEIRPEAGLSVETFGHLAYPEIQHALWHGLPGGLDALPYGLVLEA